MLTLQNFQKQINNAILLRGEKYYNNGYVASIEETGEGTWIAEVEGSETYKVELTLKNGNVISDFNCDCPYDGGICKHLAAVFFALRSEIKKMEDQPKGVSKKNVFENLLQAVTAKEYQNFMRSYAAKNKNFKTEFELFFAEKDSRIDVGEKYAEMVQKLMAKYLRQGYVDYRASLGLSKEIDGLVKTGVGYVAKNNFKDAFALTKAVLNPMMEAITEGDDSSGSMGDSIENTIELLEMIAGADAAAIDIKDQLFSFLQKELNNKIYFEYGDFGYNMFAVLQSLAVQLNKSETFVGYIDEQILKLTGQYDNYRKEYYQQSKIEFLQQTGKAGDAEKLVQENMDIVEIRLMQVNKAILKKDLATAKKIIAGGIKIAEAKDHPGTVDQWRRELLRIAVLEKDTETTRKYTKYFAFDRGFSAEYYKQWKTAFPPAEWQTEIEKHIAGIIQKVTDEWSISKNKSWRPAHPPLLQILAPIYIQENFSQRLLALIKQANDLNTTLEYHTHLVKDYSNELLAIYLQALEVYGLQSKGRSDYVYLVSKMKKIIKDIPEGKEKILDIAKRLKEKFSFKPRRPAMIEELNRIL